VAGIVAGEGGGRSMMFTLKIKIKLVKSIKKIHVHKIVVVHEACKNTCLPPPPPLILKMIETVTDNKRRRIVMIDR